MKITDDRIAELVELDRASKIAYSYIWGVLKNATTYPVTPREKWNEAALKEYYEEFMTRRRHYDEKLEIWLTPEDKKQIHKIIKNRLETLLNVGQTELL
ncbi:MAG: hypothetical protein FWG72_06225 [Oscillospiraceae bacterium]|nr:hypothetical protein [Oscillospiraceae bacterium]